MSQAGPPFFGNALLAIYRQDSGGGWLPDEPVAFGTCHESLEIREPLRRVELPVTGDRVPRRSRAPERLEVSIESTWLFQVGEPGLRPHHRDRYVLTVTWHRPEERSWLQQAFWGAEVDERLLRAQGPHAVGRRLEFSVERLTESDGYGTQSTLMQGAEQSVVSLRERAWQVGDRLLGEYRWNAAARLTSARLHANSGASVRLYLNEQPSGVLVQNSGTWTGNLEVPPFTAIHWRVEALEPESGPGVVGAVTLNLVTSPPRVADVLDLRQRLLAWVESEAFTQITRTHGLNGILAGAVVQWPDGTAGQIHVTAVNATFLAVDAFTVTFVQGGALPSYRITQPAVQRNVVGDVVVKPRPTLEEI